jgi:hypothetical protein
MKEFVSIVISKKLEMNFMMTFKNADNLLKEERKRCLKVIQIQNTDIISFMQIMYNNKHSFLRTLSSFLRKINEICSLTLYHSFYIPMGNGDEF